MTAGNKILIVDEQAEVCNLLSEYVGQEGLTAVIAHTGEAGLEKIRTEVPDTLILASRLPDMDGMQALKAAKALDEDLPVILMTHTPEIREFLPFRPHGPKPDVLPEGQTSSARSPDSPDGLAWPPTGSISAGFRGRLPP